MSTLGEAAQEMWALAWLHNQRCPQCNGEVDALAETPREGVLRLWCVNHHFWQDSPVTGRVIDVVQDRVITL